MNGSRNPIAIVLADDDLEDCMLTRDAFREAQLSNPLYMVHDGEELMDFLYRRGKHVESPRPGMILLDLNMPKKDGREALREIKADPDLRHIPVVVLTTSKAEEDIYTSYDLGVSSYITKPVRFEELVKAMKSFRQYWFEIVELPQVT